MDEKPAVIYVARTLQDAYLLKNLLADEQIESVVFNNVLEGGAGVDIVGWPTSARVAVAPADAERARQIAAQFDARLAAAAESPATEEPPAEPPTTAVCDWPLCPECHAPRMTQCPACGATGSNFRPADAAAIDILSDNAAAEAASCASCGPGGCTGEQPVPSSPTAETPESEGRESGSPAPGLVCPTCDEPFVPQYARRCQSCGHEFPDGVDMEPPDTPLEMVNTRIIAVIVGIVVLITAMVIYFATMF